MGGCNSCCRSNTKSKRASFSETVPYSKDTPLQNPTETLFNSPPKLHKPLEPPEDKRVVVHETVSAGSKDKNLHKENQNVNLLLKSAREFSGKPKNVDFGVGRHIPVKRQEKCPSKPPPEKLPSLRRSVPSRRFDSPEPRIPVRKIPVKKQGSGESRFPVRRQNSGELEISVKRLNSGDLRSGSPSVRGGKGSRRIVKEGSDTVRRTGSSRGMHLRKEGSGVRLIEEVREVKNEGFEEISKGLVSRDSEKLVVEVAEKPRNVEIVDSSDFEERSKGLVSSESEKLVLEVKEKPRNVREVCAENAASFEDVGDSALPPIDLDNPLISLDCFIFL